MKLGVTDFVPKPVDLMVLEGNPEYAHQINADDRLSDSQRAQLESQWQQFRRWWDSWPGTAA